MKLPKKLRAFGRSYSVVSDDHITKQHGCYGMLFHDEQVVYLQKRDSGFSEEKEAATFLHELMHLCDENLRIGLKEKQVELLSVGLFSLLQDNKLNFISESK